jgi:Flp pilus assembly protein TadG
VEFVILFPVIWMMFGMTIEAGMYSMQQVMLERGLDLTLREVRLGIMDNPTHEKLVTSTCENALIMVDCDSSLRLEMITSGPTTFVAPSTRISCVDKTVTTPATIEIVNGANNDLMMLRVCMQIKPLLPFAGLGKALIKDAGGDYYSLTATSAYVMEPFQ